MDVLPLLRMKLALLVGLAGLLLGIALLPSPLASAETLHQMMRLTAQERWIARPFSNYRVTVQLWKANRTCRQELMVAGEYIEPVQNTCGLFWLTLMTVDRLFERSTSLEDFSQCHASAQGRDCACQLLARGTIIYDNHWGYPRAFMVQYNALPALERPDYWLRTWELQARPQCAPTPDEQKFAVLSLVPLP